MMKGGRSLATAGLAIALVACSSLPGPTPSPGAIPAEPLRTAPSLPPSGESVCLQLVTRGFLAGDSGDPERVWLESGTGGDRLDLIWPFGFRVRFTPGAEVLAPNGDVVVREGEGVDLRGGYVGRAFQICTINGRDWPSGP